MAERKAFAARCGTTYAHLRNVMYGQRVPSEKLCVAIERESKRMITRQILRPDDWHDIWPELADMSDRSDATDDVQPPAGTPDRKEGN